MTSRSNYKRRVRVIYTYRNTRGEVDCMAISGDTQEDAERKAAEALKDVSGKFPRLTRMLEV